MYLRFDKDKFDHAHKEAMKFNFKIESLSALNEQLNSRLHSAQHAEEDLSLAQRDYKDAEGVVQRLK